MSAFVILGENGYSLAQCCGTCKNGTEDAFNIIYCTHLEKYLPADMFGICDSYAERREFKKET